MKLRERYKKEYSIWVNMRGQCERPTHKHYAKYGALGTKVCARWQDFCAFMADLGPCPEGHTLTGTGDFSLKNYSWQPKKGRTTPRSNLITFQGQTKPLAVFAEEYGIDWTALYYRLERGWDVERALTTPVRAYNATRHAGGEG